MKAKFGRVQLTTRLSVMGVPLFLSLSCIGITAVAARPSVRSQVDAMMRVGVVPAPGDRYAPPATSLTFRDATMSELAGLTVSGSQTGRHAGRISPLIGAPGYVFAPARPFAGGERVTVRAPHLDVTGVTGASYTFTTLRPVAPALARAGLAAALATDKVSGQSTSPRTGRSSTQPACDAIHYVTMQIRAPHVCMNLGVTTSGVEPGTSLFLAPGSGGAGLFGNDGRLQWWMPGPGNEGTLDATEVQYQGHPYFAVWQGPVNGGHGQGSVSLFNQHYQLAGVVQAGSDFPTDSIDLHEFQLTPSGNALVGIYEAAMDGSQPVLVYIAQEVSLVQTSTGIRTGSVLFEWDSLNDVPTSQGMVPPDNGIPWDYFHGNGISNDPSGGILVSSRNTWGIYNIDDNPRDSTFEHVVWEVGAKGDNQLSLPWCYQHNITGLGDHTYSLFDDGGYGPGCLQGSTQHPARGLIFTVDPSTKPAGLNFVAGYTHNPPILVGFTGGAQALPNGDMLVTWGNVPEITEFSAIGQVRMDLTMENASYRGFRFPWVGEPLTPPATLAKLAGGYTDIWVSWNGATQVTRWQILGGPSATRIPMLGKSHNDAAFETRIDVAGSFGTIEVQGLSANGTVLGTSKPVYTAGYVLASSSGAIAGVGQDAALSSAAPAATARTVGISKIPGGTGYWTAEANGTVVAHRGAGYFGSMAGHRLPAPIVGIAAKDGGGYWLVGADGSVYPFGDAKNLGSRAGQHLAGPIVGVAATPDGGGYWLVGANGSVFNYGDAKFFGSLAGKRLAAPIVSLAATPDGKGYWLAGADGGVFTYGDARYRGTGRGSWISGHVVGIAITTDNLGYWLLASTGQVKGFGDAPAFDPPKGAAPVAGMAVVQ